MISNFKNKGLQELFGTGSTNKINSKLQSRCLRILDALDRITRPEDMNVPGFNYHSLKGHKPTRYTVHVNGPWCITFEFDGENVRQVEFEQYH